MNEFKLVGNKMWDNLAYHIIWDQIFKSGDANRIYEIHDSIRVPLINSSNAKNHINGKLYTFYELPF